MEGESRQGEAHNCKAMLETPSSRPLGTTEPRPTFSKTSVAKVATCEARFCKIAATFGFLAHFGAETRPSKPVPAKAILDKVAKNPRNNEIFSPKMAIFEAHFGKISAKPGF